ncbi:raffinose synthase or seed imbibition protein Sip1-domain-containing protein [Morchella snyderi]|nr:raffinose synthase or seed imbibition protein Sip1-domain-containing protein [Morchella snyderi]
MPNLFFTPILNPPLACTTTHVAGRPIRFYACMEVATDNNMVINPNEQFVLMMWYTVNGRGASRAALFREITASDEDIVRLFYVQGSDKITSNINLRRDLFILDLDYDCDQGPLQFCLNYRYSDGPWLRAGSRIGSADGRIVFQKESEHIMHLSDLFTSLGENTHKWDAELVEDGEESPRVWNMTHKISTDDAIAEVAIGRPRYLEQFMALVKIAPPWIGPLHGRTSFDVSKDAALVLFQRSYDGKHVAVLPVSGLGFGSAYVTSCASGDGSIVIRGKNDGEGSASERKVQVIVAVANDPFKTVAAVTNYLKKLIMGSRSFESTLIDQYSKLELEGEDRTAWEDGLSYCTWNGLGADLGEDKILKALGELETAGVRIGNLIIDDNWQSIPPGSYSSSGTWTSFEANEKFPGGLKGLVEKIRAKWPYIRHIGVWHALHGYWDGITPGGAIENAYKTVKVGWRDNVRSVERKLTFVAPEDVGRFYDDFYQFLSSCGVDAVKTDVQCRIDELLDGKETAKMARAYQDAFKKSSIKYFDRRAIYCMSHVPQILYHSLLPDDSKPVFFRSSDDFYPNVPSTHSWHIFSNAMNMILFGQLNILPDWDMFQSSLPTYNTLHAAARCISGGPVFLTDIPGEHDVDLINSMVSPSPANAAPRALRPSKMAMASDPYVSYHAGKMLQVNNTHKHSSLLGIFNISTMALTELINVKTSFHNLDQQKEYVIRAHTTGRMTEPRGVLDGEDSFLVVSLEPSKWEIFTAVPVEVVNVKENIIKVAALGIKENITGVAALRDIRVYKGDEENTVTIQADVCALGVLVFYISDIAKDRTLERIRVHVGRKPLPERAYSFVGSVLEVDLLSVWKDMCAKGNDENEEVITVSVELS